MTGPLKGPFAGVLPLAVVAARSDGHIYTTIRYGRRRMPSYGRIPSADRWDIVNYVRYLVQAEGDRPVSGGDSVLKAQPARAPAHAGRRLRDPGPGRDRLLRRGAADGCADRLARLPRQLALHHQPLAGGAHARERAGDRRRALGRTDPPRRRGAGGLGADRLPARDRRHRRERGGLQQLDPRAAARQGGMAEPDARLHDRSRDPRGADAADPRLPARLLPAVRSAARPNPRRARGACSRAGPPAGAATRSSAPRASAGCGCSRRSTASPTRSSSRS